MKKKISKILITGSEGSIGKIIVDELKQHGYILVLLDKNSKTPIDIAKDPIIDLFKDVDTIIHLAANPSPEINKEIASNNLLLVSKVLEACSMSIRLERIINASSIHVYPYFEMYKKRQTISQTTPLSPNLYFPPAEYARAKIEAEQLINIFCKRKNISAINLRFGHVSEDDCMTKFNTEWENDLEYKTFLSHRDLRRIILSSITFSGMHSYVCTSNRSWFISDDIRFPIK